MAVIFSLLHILWCAVCSGEGSADDSPPMVKVHDCIQDPTRSKNPLPHPKESAMFELFTTLPVTFALIVLVPFIITIVKVYK